MLINLSGFSLAQNKRRQLTGFAAVMAFALLVCAPGEALARGTDTHYNLAPLDGIYNGYYVPDLVVELSIPTIQKISVTSILEQGDKVVDQVVVVRGYEIDPSRFTQTAKRASSKDYQRSSARVEFPVPHERPLAKGVYAQRIEITIWDAALDVPVVQSAARFLSVEDAGISEIDATAYSDAIEPLRYIEGENGVKEPVYYGSALTTSIKLPERLMFDRQEPAEKADGWVTEVSESNEP